MIDREKVIKGFTVCSEHGLLNGEDCHGHYEYTDNLADIIKANDYSKQCPYNGCKTGCVKTLAKDALALLKEQEAVEPKTEPSAKGYWYTCGACGWWLFEVRDTVHFDDRKRVRFCSSCGRAVKWE